MVAYARYMVRCTCCGNGYDPIVGNLCGIVRVDKIDATVEFLRKLLCRGLPATLMYHYDSCTRRDQFELKTESLTGHPKLVDMLEAWRVQVGSTEVFEFGNLVKHNVVATFVALGFPSLDHEKVSTRLRLKET